MTTPPITATRPVLLGGCLRCSCGWPHTVHDTSLPAVQRSTIQANPKGTAR